MNQTAFSRPRPKRSAAIAADIFMDGATANAIDPDAAPAPVDVVPAPTFTPKASIPKRSRETKEPEVVSQTVRFTEREKLALIRLSETTKRSEHFIIKEILGPALLARAAALDGKTGAP